jgi:hypothetical protein
MKRHHGIAVGGNHPGTGIDEGIVGLFDKMRAFQQRQRRPFRLLERRTDTFEFAAHAAIKNSVWLICLSMQSLHQGAAHP